MSRMSTSVSVEDFDAWRLLGRLCSIPKSFESAAFDLLV